MLAHVLEALQKASVGTHSAVALRRDNFLAKNEANGQNNGSDMVQTSIRVVNETYRNGQNLLATFSRHTHSATMA